MEDQIIDVESTEIIDGSDVRIEDVFEDIEPPETIEGLDGFNVLEFVKLMKDFEDKYDLADRDFSIEVFETEEEQKIWQVQSETGTHNFNKYEDLKECLESTPERLINV